MSRSSLLPQAAFAMAIVGVVAWLAGNLSANLAARGLASGYDFLADSAGFAISEGPVPYEPGNTYLRAFAAGAANTVLAALPALALTTLLGGILGVASISRIAPLRGLVRVYVDGARNVPLLVQALFWYVALAHALPDARHPFSIGAVHLTKAGLTMPHPLGGPSVEFGFFGLTGGLTISTEFLALVLALALYSGAYCAELVRAGLIAVGKGQWEAAASIGLRRGQIVRLVVLPQALRVIVPPYISLAMNVVKNSSLGVAIGYPEIVSVGTTSLNQTGRAVECVSIIALLYLAINLVLSAILSVYNSRVRIVER